MDSASESAGDSGLGRDWGDDGRKSSTGSLDDLNGVVDGDSSDVENCRIRISNVDIVICLTLCFS